MTISGVSIAWALPILLSFVLTVVIGGGIGSLLRMWKMQDAHTIQITSIGKELDALKENDKTSRAEVTGILYQLNQLATNVEVIKALLQEWKQHQS